MLRHTDSGVDGEGVGPVGVGVEGEGASIGGFGVIDGYGKDGLGDIGGRVGSSVE